ncbi:hypothetical protein GCK32_016809 [Trichostrongylus colubriformis]|uniref:Uncharacterized protein n=1 Tax=Trichostrongylus colubriformis TaxID=6319 RepID=A0AAN8F9V3_TRICO
MQLILLSLFVPFAVCQNAADLEFSPYVYSAVRIPFKNVEDIEKTQDGREDDAERFVRANAYIKTEAEKRFRAVEKFLKKATEDMERMIRSVEDRQITMEEIYAHMDKCEGKRQSFALLSCDMNTYCRPLQRIGESSLDGRDTVRLLFFARTRVLKTSSFT